MSDGQNTKGATAVVLNSKGKILVRVVCTEQAPGVWAALAGKDKLKDVASVVVFMGNKFRIK